MTKINTRKWISHASIVMGIIAFLAMALPNAFGREQITKREADKAARKIVRVDSSITEKEVSLTTLSKASPEHACVIVCAAIDENEKVNVMGVNQIASSVALGVPEKWQRVELCAQECAPGDEFVDIASTFVDSDGSILSFGDVSSGGNGGGGGGVSIVSAGGGGPSATQVCEPPSWLSNAELAYLYAQGYTCDMLNSMSRSEIRALLEGMDDDDDSDSANRRTGTESEECQPPSWISEVSLRKMYSLGYTCEDLHRLGYQGVWNILNENGHFGCDIPGLSDAQVACLLRNGYTCQQITNNMFNINNFLQASGCGSCGLGMDPAMVQCLLGKGLTCEQINAAVANGTFGELVVSNGCCNVPGLSSKELACLLNAGLTCAQIRAALANGTLDSLLQQYSCSDTTSSN